MKQLEQIVARRAYERMLASPPPKSVTPLRDASAYVLAVLEWPYQPQDLTPAKIWKIESRLRRAYAAKLTPVQFDETFL